MTFIGEAKSAERTRQRLWPPPEGSSLRPGTVTPAWQEDLRPISKVKPHPGQTPPRIGRSKRSKTYSSRYFSLFVELKVNCVAPHRPTLQIASSNSEKIASAPCTRVRLKAWRHGSLHGKRYPDTGLAFPCRLQEVQPAPTLAATEAPELP